MQTNHFAWDGCVPNRAEFTKVLSITAILDTKVGYPSCLSPATLGSRFGVAKHPNWSIHPRKTQLFLDATYQIVSIISCISIYYMKLQFQTKKQKNTKRSITRLKHDIRFCWHFLLGTSFGRALKQQAHSVSFRLTDSHAVWVYNLSLPKNSLKIISTVKSHMSIILLIIHQKKIPQCLFFYCASPPSSMPPTTQRAWSFGYDP